MHRRGCASLAKPFPFDELLARIRARCRRGGAERLDVLRYDVIALDRLRHEPLCLTVAGKVVERVVRVVDEGLIRRSSAGQFADCSTREDRSPGSCRGMPLPPHQTDRNW